ncbi:MAG: phosphoesterase [bacterium]|nr:phosphoesterase [bacterium]
MKIQILSDLHIEFESFEWTDVGADIVVLAGDTHLGEMGVNWAKRSIRDRPVLYIMGNHEYYSKSFPRLVLQLKERTIGSNVQVLEQRGVTLGDIAFLGCTLWTDFNLNKQPRQDCLRATTGMADYRRIKVSPAMTSLTPENTIEIHKRTLAWLLDARKSCGDKKVVVVTHHGPSPLSLPINDERDVISSAYVSDLEKVIAEMKPELWIHGHVHEKVDYLIGDTRVVCNPRGYPRQIDTGFDPEFCVEI